MHYLQTHLSSVFVPSTKNSQIVPRSKQGPESSVESIMTTVRREVRNQSERKFGKYLDHVPNL